MNYQIIKYYRQIALTTRIPGVLTYTGPGDVITAVAVSWWGLRAYSDATVGRNSVTLRRDSDNATQSFATLDNGDLDLTAITTFKGAANLFVDTLYDQVGNTHLTQPAGAGTHQPQFILNGLGTNPVIRHDRTFPQWLQSTGIINLAQPFTWSTVAMRTTTAAPPHWIVAAGSQEAGWSSVNTADMFQSGGIAVTGAATDNVFHAIQYIFNGANCDVSVDGLDNFGNPGVTTNMTNTQVAIGADLGGATGTSNMDFLEAGIWGIAFSTQQENALSVNQHSAWGF